MTTTPQRDWTDPGYFHPSSRVRSTGRVLLQLVKPPKGHATVPTKTGFMLIAISLGIGTAAFNTAQNILYIALALLLSALLLSGLLSWLNFSGVRWRLTLEPHFRAGEPTPLRVEAFNRNKWLPIYSLWFELQLATAGDHKRLYLHERIAAKGNQTLEWLYTPPDRGVETVQLARLGSKFPFGFLRKTIALADKEEVAVWPARARYTFKPPASQRAHRDGHLQVRAGSGTELINLREYRHGDPLKAVHWKASARQRQLLVREMAEENDEAFLLIVSTEQSIWGDGELLERLCRVAGTLAEDLFMQHRLGAVILNEAPLQPIRQIQDVHAFLSALAAVDPLDTAHPPTERGRLSPLTFTPAGLNRLEILLDGHVCGSA